MTRKNLLRWLAAGVAVVWCILFLRSDNTQKSIVRAMLLEQTETGWSAGLLYQFPEASADASETDAPIRFALAAGKTPQAALRKVEEKLPRKASYRLCDYLLLGQESDLGTLQDCEALFLEHPYGRLSSRVTLAAFSGAELESETEEEESLPETLLEQLEADDAAPHLYENRNGILLPVLELEEGELSGREERVLLTGTGKTLLTAEQTETALFLSGAANVCRLQNDTDPLELTALAQSVEAEGDGFHLLLTCRCPSGSRRPSEEELARWTALCGETVTRCWENGFDLLRLGAVRRLQKESDVLTTKNACPELRTDVVLF